MDDLCKILYFLLIWFLNFLFSDLVLIEIQLIFISYKKVELKE